MVYRKKCVFHAQVCTTLGRKEEEEVSDTLKIKTKLAINCGGEAPSGHGIYVYTCMYIYIYILYIYIYIINMYNI